MNAKTIISWAAAFGAFAVILGALGAHALEARLSADSLTSFETGVRYQAWHVLALLAVGMGNFKLRYLKGVVICWVVGTFLFSGSIYMLSTSAVSGISFKLLGPVTPIGGLLLIAGWVLLFVSALRSRS